MNVSARRAKIVDILHDYAQHAEIIEKELARNLHVVPPPDSSRTESIIAEYRARMGELVDRIESRVDAL